MPFEPYFAPTLQHAAEVVRHRVGGVRDPFSPIVIGMGNRAQETWLRQELATQEGIAANWHVLPWRTAVERAARACLRVEGYDPERWWIDPPAVDDPWQAERLRGRVAEAFRSMATLDGCEDLSSFLFGGTTPPEATSWRELALAGEVAQVITRLMWEHPDVAVAWAQEPGVEPKPPFGAPRWFRQVCMALQLDDDDSPARVFQRLRNGQGKAVAGPPLVVFGLSSCSSAEGVLLRMLHGHMDVHWIRVLNGVGRSKYGAHPEPSSPVLRSLGLADEGLDHMFGIIPPYGTPTATTTWLEALQSSARFDLDIDHASLPAEDPSESITFHACYSPLRQVELLRDTLLRWFAAERDLEPRDVLVLTPDLGTYAPLIQAVFARRGAADSKLRLLQYDEQQEEGAGDSEEGDDTKRERKPDPRPPAIPVAIANLGLVRTNPVAEAVLAALELCEERVTAPRLLAMLSLEPVRKRFGLSHDDAADLRALLVDSGMRWGLDGADRSNDGQPELHQNTIEFGLERLALGSLMAEDGDGVLELDSLELGPLVPMAVDGRSRVARVARLAAIVRAIGAARTRFREEKQRSMHGWNQALRQLMDDVAETSKAATWLQLQVAEVLDEVLPGTESEPGPKLELRALRKLVAGHFELPTRGDRVVSGAVAVRPLALDSATPAKVICFLGMDDGAFPSAHRPREWEPVDEQRPVYRDPRIVERLAMLQALMAAQGRVFVAWSGFELKRGRPLPPCVPVDELVQIAADATGQKRAAIVRSHPRHPWGRSDLAQACFDRGLLSAAVALAEGRSVSSEHQDLALPPEEHPVTDLPLERLARDLVNPAKLYLYGRLSVYLDEGQEPIPDREPIELNKLDEWTVRSEALQVAGTGSPEEQVEAVVRRLAGKGVLPLQAGGRLLAEAAVEKVNEMRQAFASVAGQVCDEGPWTVPLSCGITVSGAPQQVREQHGALLLEWLVPSRAESEKVLLNAWVHLLAARACDDRVVAARLVGSEASERWLLLPDDDPTKLLDGLARLWQRGRLEPLPLLPRCSMALAEVMQDKSEEERLLLKVQAKAASDVRQAWLGYGEMPGTGADRWVAALQPGLDPDQVARDLEPGGFVETALQVWEPVIKALAKTPPDGWEIEGGEA